MPDHSRSPGAPGRAAAGPQDPGETLTSPADTMRDIQSITDAALSALDPQSFLDALVERTKKALNADTAAVLLLDNWGRQRIATAASGLEEEVS